MANFDPNTGAPLAPQKKRGGRIALIIVAAVLVCQGKDRAQGQRPRLYAPGAGQK